MIKNRRLLWIFISLFIGVIIVLTLFVAPSRNKLMSGSTFAVSPDGYAAWYEFMKKRKTPIERWKKSFETLEKKYSQNAIVLLKIYGKNPNFSVNNTERKWVGKGNTLVVLAFQGRVTEADFSTSHKTEFGEVKIETTRRKISYNKAILEDKFGAIVCKIKESKGQIIYVTTPYLAANAYKLSPGNYQFLAHLLESTPGNKILVDEYIHGYKDKEVRESEENNNVFAYLFNTPLLIILIQGLLMILIVIIANNNYLERKKKLTQPIANNSQEYINALATILHNAKSREFIIETIGKAEQLQLQKELGLRVNKEEIDSVVQNWSQQVGKSPIILETLLKISIQKSSLNDAKLLEWMKQWQTIHQDINSNQSNYDNQQ
ncbi:MAG: DUF4350 domain-containing protein [Crocosphaera sp.]